MLLYACKVSGKHCDRSAQHRQSAVGSLVFEEDSTGDAMYVVLSGDCAIRARPAHAVSIPQQQSQPVSTVLLQPKLTAGAHESGSDTDEEETPSSASLPPRVARSEAEHSSSFWIHKYMQQVVLSCNRAYPGVVVWFSAALSQWHEVFAGSLEWHTNQEAALHVLMLHSTRNGLQLPVCIITI